MGEALGNSHNPSGFSPRQARGRAWDACKVPTVSPGERYAPVLYTLRGSRGGTHSFTKCRLTQGQGPDGHKGDLHQVPALPQSTCQWRTLGIDKG